MNTVNNHQMKVVEQQTVAPEQHLVIHEEMDRQVAIAHRYPRNIASFKAEALAIATADEETAASCFYKLPRKKKDANTGEWIQTFIEGPGVRLAEIAASCWRNIRYGARIVREEEGCVVAQGMAHDLEKNNIITLEVKRRITYSNGKRYNEDLITLASNAASAIALRNVIFKVIPKPFVDSIYIAAKQMAVGNADTLDERRDRALKYFLKMGVSEQRILATLGKNNITEIGLEELEVLKGVGTAIKDGDAKVDEIFPKIGEPEDFDEPVNKTQSLANKIKKINSQKNKEFNSITEV